MVSRSRKMRQTRNIGTISGGNMLKTSRHHLTQIKKEKKSLEREAEKYEKLDRVVTKTYGKKYIQNEPPFYWKCGCGAVTRGGAESKVGNSVVVRCRSCDSTSVRVIKEK